MRLSKDKLLGWLCILRLNFENEEAFSIPVEVQRQLVERGWLTIDEDADYDGKHRTHVTDAGALASDLVCAEWGIDPICA